LSTYYFFYLKIKLNKIIGTIFKHNSCESSDDRSCDMNAIGDTCKFTMKCWCTSWICCVINRVHITWMQTDHHSILI